MFNVLVSIYAISVLQNLELETVAADLKIPLKTLKALEQDDYKTLPEAAFIKGYYRSYAKYLGTDATAIIQRFDEIYANDTGLLPNHALNNSRLKLWVNCLVLTVTVTENG